MAGGESESSSPDRLRGLELQMDEARRQLELQWSDLQGLKARTGVLLGAASVVTGLVAGLAAKGGFLDRSMIVVAVAAYVIAVGLCVDVIRPQPWKFSHKMHDFEELDRVGNYPRHRDVAWHFIRTFQMCRRANAGRLARLQNEYFAACILLGVQVVAWGIAAL
jgi:hypothetical protein